MTLSIVTELMKLSEPRVPEVACVAIFHHGKILMGRRRDNHLWTQPGGHLEGEESPVAGAVREVKEEAGIDIEPHTLKHLLTETVTKPDGKKIKVHAFRAVIHKAPTSIKEDPDAEVHRWHWLSLETLFSPKVWGELHVKPEENVVMKGLGFHTSGKQSDSFHNTLRERLGQNDHQKSAALKSPKHPDAWYPKDQVEKGMIVEKEHSEDPKIRSTITKNHLDERKDYYNDSLFKSDLKKEGSMKNFWDGFEKQAYAVAYVPLKTQAAKDSYVKETARAGRIGGGAAGALGGGIAGSSVGHKHFGTKGAIVGGVGGTIAGGLGVGALGHYFGKKKGERYAKAGIGRSHATDLPGAVEYAKHYKELNKGDTQEKSAFWKGFSQQ